MKTYIEVSSLVYSFDVNRIVPFNRNWEELQTCKQRQLMTKWKVYQSRIKRRHSYFPFMRKWLSIYKNTDWKRVSFLRRFFHGSLKKKAPSLSYTVKNQTTTTTVTKRNNKNETWLDIELSWKLNSRNENNKRWWTCGGGTTVSQFLVRGSTPLRLTPVLVFQCNSM